MMHKLYAYWYIYYIPGIVESAIILILQCVCVCMCVCVHVCVCVCVFIKLHINGQSGPVIPVILCHSH